MSRTLLAFSVFFGGVLNSENDVGRCRFCSVMQRDAEPKGMGDHKCFILKQITPDYYKRTKNQITTENLGMGCGRIDEVFCQRGQGSGLVHQHLSACDARPV